MFQQSGDTVYVDTLSLRVKASTLLPQLFGGTNAASLVSSAEPVDKAESENGCIIWRVLHDIGWLVIVITGFIIIYCAILVGYTGYRKKYEQQLKYSRRIVNYSIIIGIVATLFLLGSRFKTEFAIAVVAGIISSLLYSMLVKFFSHKNEDYENKSN